VLETIYGEIYQARARFRATRQIVTGRRLATLGTAARNCAPISAEPLRCGVTREELVEIHDAARALFGVAAGDQWSGGLQGSFAATVKIGRQAPSASRQVQLVWHRKSGAVKGQARPQRKVEDRTDVNGVSLGMRIFPPSALPPRVDNSASCQKQCREPGTGPDRTEQGIMNPVNSTRKPRQAVWLDFLPAASSQGRPKKLIDTDGVKAYVESIDLRKRRSAVRRI